MKKLIIVFTMSAICGAAFGEPDTFVVTSSNKFGSYKVAASTDYVMLAAPFEGFEGKASGSTCTPGTILARDLVATSSLAQDDSLSLYKPNTTDVYDYDNYTLDITTISIPGYGDYTSRLWAKSGWFSGDSMVVYNPPKPEDRTVKVGEGFFVGRDSDNNVEEDVYDYTVYAYGQIPQTDVKTVTISGTPKTEDGKTVYPKMLLCPPGANALVQVNLNDFKWEGVTAAQGVVEPGFAVVTPSDNADQIYYRKSDGNTYVRAFYLDGEDGGWYVQDRGIWSKTAAVVPAGQSFWYLKAGSEPVTVIWAE